MTDLPTKIVQPPRTYTVRTTFFPGVQMEVGKAEYDSLAAWGVLVEDPADPSAATPVSDSDASTEGTAQ